VKSKISKESIKQRRKIFLDVSTCTSHKAASFQREPQHQDCQAHLSRGHDQCILSLVEALNMSCIFMSLSLQISMSDPCVSSISWKRSSFD